MSADVLAKDEGTWDAEVEVRPAPGAEVQRSKGVMTARRIAGGAWLVMDFKNETGFEGHGVFGWDPAKKRFVAVWVDPMRTSLAPMEGDWDPERRTMTMHGQMALADGRVIAWREVTESVDPSTQIFRTFFPAADGDHEMMKVVYKKRA